MAFNFSNLPTIGTIYNPTLRDIRVDLPHSSGFIIKPGVKYIVKVNKSSELIAYQNLCRILGLVFITGSNLELTKYDDFLYETNYEALDEGFAYEYLRNKYKPQPSACSAVRNGNYYGRNLDWEYNNQVDFVIRHKSESGLKSLSVCTIPELLKNNLDNPDLINYYNVLPFLAQDGLNSAGVFCNINVVPDDYGKVTEVYPLHSSKVEVCSSALVRYILDNYGNARQAVEDLSNHVSIFNTNRLTSIGFSSHYMLGDLTNTYILEFKPDSQGVMRLDYHEQDFTVNPYDNLIMTNFYNNGVSYNSDGTVYTPATQTSTKDAIRTNLITEHGMGLERYNQIVSGYSSSGSLQGMVELMHSLDYRRTYSNCPKIYGEYRASNPFWYTEYVEGLLKVNSPIQSFSIPVDLASVLFENRVRGDGLTWHTTHSSIYDLSNKTLTLFTSSESEIGYTFSL